MCSHCTALIVCAFLIAETSERSAGSVSGQADVLEAVDRVELTGGKLATFTVTDLTAEVSDTEVLCCAVQPHQSICYERRVAMAFTDAVLSPDAVRKKVRRQTST